MLKTYLYNVYNVRRCRIPTMYTHNVYPLMFPTTYTLFPTTYKSFIYYGVGIRCGEYVYVVGTKVYVVGEKVYVVGEKVYVVGENVYVVGNITCSPQHIQTCFPQHKGFHPQHNLRFSTMYTHNIYRFVPTT